MSDTSARRVLRIEPCPHPQHPDYVQVLDGDAVIAAFTTRAGAEQAIASGADLGWGEPGYEVDGREVGDMLAELAAEIETLKDKVKGPHEYGLDSVDHRREVNPTPAWEAHVEEKVIKKFKSDNAALDKDIVEWIDRSWDSWVKAGWRDGMVKKRKSEEWGRKRATLAKLVSDLRKAKKLPRNPRRPDPTK
jgi:hypothetical protein